MGEERICLNGRAPGLLDGDHASSGECCLPLDTTPSLMTFPPCMAIASGRVVLQNGRADEYDGTLTL